MSSLDITMADQLKNEVLAELKMLAPAIVPVKLSYPVDAAFFAHQKAKKNIRGLTSGLIITPDNKIVLARRRNWLMPGGGVEIGETFASAMEREITEEVGIAVHDVSLIAIDEEEFVSPDGDKVFSILAVFSMKTNSVQLPPLTVDAKEEGIEEMTLFAPDKLPLAMALTDREKIIACLAAKPVI